MGNAFKIVYDPLVIQQDLRSLDRPTLVLIKKAIESKLQTRPDLYGKPLRGPLSGYWSLRVGDYRVAYRLKSSTVYIDVIDHRSGVYETLQDRIS